MYLWWILLFLYLYKKFYCDSLIVEHQISMKCNRHQWIFHLKWLVHGWDHSITAIFPNIFREVRCPLALWNKSMKFIKSIASAQNSLCMLSVNGVDLIFMRNFVWKQIIELLIRFHCHLSSKCSRGNVVDSDGKCDCSLYVYKHIEQTFFIGYIARTNMIVKRECWVEHVLVMIMMMRWFIWAVVFRSRKHFML